jgi:hypothetical protein
MSDHEQRPQDEEAPETVATTTEESDEGPDVEGQRFKVGDASTARTVREKAK